MIRITLALLGLTIAGGLFAVYTKPTYDSVQQAKAQLAEYDGALDKAAELQALKQTLLARFNAFDPNDLDRLQKLLPDHVDNVRLVLDLDTLASKYGLALQNVVISNPASKSVEANTITIATSKQTFDSLTLKFTTRGTYEDFVRFLESLERSLRIVDLVALDMNRAEEEGGDPIFTYDITLRTYWLK